MLSRVTVMLDWFEILVVVFLFDELVMASRGHKSLL